MTPAAQPLRQYALVTGSYWMFTLSDGALRMLVVLYFHQLGFSPLAIASLFLFYELFGVVTNLLGGWLGARIGLNRLMNIGLVLQVVALAMLLVPGDWLTVVWVMAAQALSGTAKDLNKMSAKSAVKLLVPSGNNGQLFRWVAALTGSKNALKGFGFFLGGLLLSVFGFQGAVIGMLAAISLTSMLSFVFLKPGLGKASTKPKFTDLLSKSRSINLLSAARLFLFGSRDVWFVVALPVYLSTAFGWSYTEVGSFFAVWIIGYGIIQSFAPRVPGLLGTEKSDASKTSLWGGLLTISPFALALIIGNSIVTPMILIVGLLVFGVLFAINSSLHSYLIVEYSRRDGVSLDVGFYYMANALGRLLGTVLSGLIYGSHGLAACLYVSGAFLVIATIISAFLPRGVETPSVSSK